MSICRAVIPVFRAGDFEVHIAVMIFGARDVGQDGVFVAFLHQTHRHAADRSGDRHARIHQRDAGAADGRHRTRTVRFENVAHHAQRVGETVFVGNHRADRAFGQSAMPDFAAARAAHEAHFADAERREVVMQHEALEGFARFEQFDALLVVFGAESDGNQRLRFAAGEQRGTVRARQNARFAPDLADLVERAAIGTPARIQHLVAEDLLFQRVEELAGFGLLLVRCFLDGRIVQRVDLRVAFELGVFLACSVRRSDLARTLLSIAA